MWRALRRAIPDGWLATPTFPRRPLSSLARWRGVITVEVIAYTVLTPLASTLKKREPLEDSRRHNKRRADARREPCKRRSSQRGLKRTVCVCVCVCACVPACLRACVRACAIMDGNVFHFHSRGGALMMMQHTTSVRAMIIIIIIMSRSSDLPRSDAERECVYVFERFNGAALFWSQSSKSIVRGLCSAYTRAPGTIARDVRAEWETIW